MMVERGPPRGFLGVVEWSPLSAAPSGGQGRASECRVVHDAAPTTQMTRVSGGQSFVCARGGRGLAGTVSQAKLQEHGVGEVLESFLREARGEFAIACWDQEREELRLVRDLFGTVPLFYLTSVDRTVFGTDFEAVARASDRVLDRSYLATFMAARVDLEATVYRDIKKAPPAHIVSITRRGLEKATYWDPDAIGIEVLPSDAEYEERLRSLVRDGLEERLASEKVAFELSGGWDSSCLLAAATEMRHPSRPPITSFSYTYDLSPTSDETFFIDSVVAHTGVRSVQFKESDHALLRGLKGAAAGQPSPTPLVTRAELCSAVNMRCREEGVTALVSGEGGDHLFLSQDLSFPVLAMGEGAKISQRMAQASLWSRYLRRSVWNLATDALRSTPKRGIRGQRLFRSRATYAPWLGPDVRDFLDDQRHRWAGEARRHGTAIAKRRQSLDRLRRLVSPSHWDGVLDARPTYPYLDRQVVEFLLSTPASQIRRPNEWRSLQQRSFGHLLPDTVLRRAGKRGPGAAIARAVKYEGAAVADWFSGDGSACGNLGLIDDARFRQALDRMRHGRLEWMGNVVWVLALEAWLQSHRSSYRH